MDSGRRYEDDKECLTRSKFTTTFYTQNRSPRHVFCSAKVSVYKLFTVGSQFWCFYQDPITANNMTLTKDMLDAAWCIGAISMHRWIDYLCIDRRIESKFRCHIDVMHISTADLNRSIIFLTWLLLWMWLSKSDSSSTGRDLPKMYGTKSVEIAQLTTKQFDLTKCGWKFYYL